MEKEHLEAGQLDRLRRGELAPAEVIAATTHLANCEACSAHGSDPRAQSVIDRLVADSRDDHPSDDDLIRFVDSTLPTDDRERIEAHLGICDRCSADVDDLREVAASMAKPNRFDRRRMFLAVAAILVAIVAALLWLRRPGAPTPTVQPPVIRVTPPPPTPTEPPMKPEWASLVKEAVRGGRLAMPQSLREIYASPETIRGEGEARKQSVSPAEEVVETDRPTFRWPASKGSESVVFVYRGDDELAVSKPVRGNSWTPSKPLPRGVPLVWQVEVRRGGESTVIPSPPDPPAMFRIVEEAALGEIETAKQLHPDDHLLVGVLYARAGLRQRAIDELRQDPSPDAAKLLASLKKWP